MGGGDFYFGYLNKILMKLRFFEDSKLQSQFITVEKTLDNQRPVQNPVKHLSWSLLQINCVYSEVHYF